MPFAGLGLHFLLALLCAVHAVRNRQPMYWLFILFAFPLLGSLVYFVAVYLPNSRLERGAMRAVSAAVKAIDPTREVRDAQAAFDDAPTAQNQMRLAAALLEVGDAAAAARHYEACLKGPFASDPDIRMGAARAALAGARFDDALQHLAALQQSRPEYRNETVEITRARCLAGLGRNDEARQAFEATVARFGTYEAQAEYAIWAFMTGDTATAQRLDAELERIAARWNPLARELNEPVRRRLLAARSAASK